MAPVLVTATVLAHFFYQATMVLLRMYASFLYAQVVIVWNIAKWMPTICSTLWVLTIRLGEGLFLPVACRMVSYLWTCLSDTYWCMYRGSGAMEAISYISTKRELWVLSLCPWRAYIVGCIVGSAIIVMVDHFDAFDKRTARAVVLPPGAYNYGRAYKVDYRADDENANGEE
jgi:hypothetical protein